MANWYGKARTNYFRVKDVEAFRETKAFKNLEVEVIDKDGMVGLLAEGEFGDFPSGYHDENDEWVDVDVEALVAEHLIEGEVAVFMTVGWEKMRYLTGSARAINSAGQTRQVDLDDIYDLARRELGPNVTTATY